MLRNAKLDDRIGCALVTFQSKLEYDTTFTFVVFGEEVGLRGRGRPATVNPEISIVLGRPPPPTCPARKRGGQQVCGLEKSPVSALYEPLHRLRQRAYGRRLRLRRMASHQTKTMIAGGNDAGAVHVARGGGMAVSAPFAYIHSPVCVVNQRDLTDMAALTRLLAAEFAGAEEL